MSEKGKKLEFTSVCDVCGKMIDVKKPFIIWDRLNVRLMKDGELKVIGRSDPLLDACSEKCEKKATVRWRGCKISPVSIGQQASEQLAEAEEDSGDEK